MRPAPIDYLVAAKANNVPANSMGRWAVHKVHIRDYIFRERAGRIVAIKPGFHTQLMCWTKEEIQKALDSCGGYAGGECVMEDSEQELKTHLNFMMRASGRVLITGLGLGCVVRGALLNPQVDHVTVVEREQDVIDLVAPFMPHKDRLTIVHDDARHFASHCKAHFECAWHDVWSDPDQHEQKLAHIHTQLMGALSKNVDHQQAWEYPRFGARFIRTLEQRNHNNRKERNKMSVDQGGPTVGPQETEIRQTKQHRKDLDELLQRLKRDSDKQYTGERTPDHVVRSSRERSLAVTKLQEAIMWLGMDLKALNTPNPYPNSYNPESPTIDPTADGLKL